MIRTIFLRAKRNQNLATIVINRGPTGPKGDDGSGGGDMAAATYDPQGIADDAFAMENMTEGADAKVMTAAERNAIAALGTASTREADQDLRTTDNVEFAEVTAQTVNLHTAAFDTTNGGPTALGEMAWDSVDGTLDIQADGGVKIAVGEDGMIRVRNTSGTTIAKGAPLVYAGTTGASGKLEVGPWIGANVSNVRTFLGFAAGAMANNTDGYAVWFGKIKEIPTDGGAELWNDGDIIYAIAGASATLSNVAPTSGDYVTAAVVINAGSGTSGILFSRPTFDTVPAASVINFEDLGDAATADLPTINTPLSTALGLKADASSLATVATSGSYADLTGTPSLATVATSGAYSDLSGTPTLGTAASVDADQNLRTDDDVRFSSIRTSGATIYGLDDGSGNTAYAQFAHTATGDLEISTEKTGTGTAGSIIFSPGNGRIDTGSVLFGYINGEARTFYAYSVINNNSLYFFYEARLNNFGTTPNIQFGISEAYRKKIISSSAKQTWMKLNVPVAQSGSASYTGLDIDALEDSLGSGQSYLIQAGVNGTYHFNVTREGNLGIGTTTPARKLHISDAMRLEPTTTPASPSAGDIYFDSSTNKLRCYDGTAWNDLF